MLLQLLLNWVNPRIHAGFKTTELLVFLYPHELVLVPSVSIIFFYSGGG